ncbi:hypothetical protein NAEGRDRAFT_78572 [Naegleria gruberi]|uniref:Uncharacterized protein n=1 Tax=Naegleria gruberi TaxID=5762 RepID=D2V4L1_NAEGR|nr:uncharacterized protein NAEGRDRAFT_78572 [Naegleria gruberi]EFC48119.1 hypothetical protein NAEGRDRAFT_78572 [Naegleria gruberi]|eukprot:XP_002680863.1 hypothetical protein NAEGRDRAFT_78572 [Naegleria gruberi strain NEG-M]
MILSIQKASHKSPDILEYPNWIITLFQAWKHIVNANFAPAETLLNSAKTQKDYFDKQVQQRLEKLNIGSDDQRLYFYYSEVEPHYSIGYHHYYNSQFPKALEELMAIWKMTSNRECDYKSELPPEFRSSKQSSGKKRKIERGKIILNPYYKVKIPSMIGQSCYHIANDENTSEEEKEKLLRKALKFFTISIIMTRKYKSMSGVVFSDANTYLQREAIYRHFGRLDLALDDLTSVITHSQPYYDILSIYYAYEAKRDVVKKMIEKITSDEAYSIITEKYREHKRLTDKAKLIEDILTEIYYKLEYHTLAQGEDKVVSPYIQICRAWNTGVPQLLERKCDYFLFARSCQYVPLIEGFIGVDVPINIENALLICDMRLDFAHRQNEPESVIKKYVSHLSHLLYRTIYDDTTSMMYSKGTIRSMFILPGKRKGFSRAIFNHFSDLTIRISSRPEY